jgi:hypothetical protein
VRSSARRELVKCPCMETALTILGVIIGAFATAFFSSRFHVNQATTDLRNEYQRRVQREKVDAYTGFATTVKNVLISTKAVRARV